MTSHHPQCGHRDPSASRKRSLACCPPCDCRCLQAADGHGTRPLRASACLPLCCPGLGLPSRGWVEPVQTFGCNVAHPVPARTLKKPNLVRPDFAWFHTSLMRLTRVPWSVFPVDRIGGGAGLGRFSTSGGSPPPCWDSLEGRQSRSTEIVTSGCAVVKKLN